MRFEPVDIFDVPDDSGPDDESDPSTWGAWADAVIGAPPAAAAEGGAA